MASKIWASSNNSGHLVCASGASDQSDPSNGDLSWDVGLRFEKLMNLVTSLESKNLTASSLAICAHGYPGMVDLDCVFPSNTSLTQSGGANEDDQYAARVAKCLTVKTYDQFKPLLVRIANRVEDNGSIYFMSCNMASGSSGAELLQLLSRDAWRKQTVVGFTRIGKRSSIALGCGDLPGLKFDLDSYSPSATREQAAERAQRLLNVPWASASSPVAKVARQGNLVKDPDFVDWSSLFVGRWVLEIGKWTGTVTFEAEAAQGARLGTCYWAGQFGEGTKHMGTWSNLGEGNYMFLFKDDPKGRQREFHFKLEGPSNGGKILINKSIDGYFTIRTDRDRK